MTAVLPPMDALLKDRRAALEDSAPDFSASTTDWREKYIEVVDMLTETRAELDDFQAASKDLEAELEAELQRTEKEHRALQSKVSRAESERDDWKSKFMSLQTTHNTTTTSLQRELDTLRQEFQKTKVYLRELEMGNDDLERNERAVSTSLAEMESKYSRILEEKILLEHELLEKATLEEQTLRLKDELRDANVEISILRDQLATATSRASSVVQPSSSRASFSSEENLSVTPPPDLTETELRGRQDPANTTPKASLSRQPGSLLLKSTRERPSTLASNLRKSVNRSTTMPSLNNPAPSSGSRTFIRPPVARTVSTVTTLTTTTGSMTKNKGVQMVSEMRARFQNLEQKIHTRVPRLRMGSITNRMPTPTTPVTSSSTTTFGSSMAKTSVESTRKGAESRSSQESDKDRKSRKEDSSGWVLIMDDSPSPRKDRERFRSQRKPSNGQAPTSFKIAPSNLGNSTLAMSTRPTSPSLSTPPFSSSTLRRPQTRISSSTTSRPQTPTGLPISANLYASTSGSGFRRSTGPNSSPFKMSTYGREQPDPVTPTRYRERPVTMPPLSHTSSLSTDDGTKDLPSLPDLPSFPLRSSTRLASGTSLLSKSRIGRPGGRLGARYSGSGESAPALDINDLQPRY